MDYKKINEVLSSLDLYDLERKYTVVASVEANYGEETDQGENGKKEVILDLGFDGLFLKVCEETDSYGDDATITSIQFVKPKLVEVTNYEAL